MNKKIITFLGIIFILFYINKSYATEKIAFIDLNYVYTNSKVGKKIITETQKKQKIINKELKDFQKKLDDEKNDLVTQKNVLAEEEFKKNALFNIERSSNETGFTRQLIAILADKDRYDEVRSIKIPTLVIHGRLDPLIPFEEGRKTADMIPNSQFLPVDIMSHLIDEPVLEIIEDPLVNFLAENS